MSLSHSASHLAHTATEKCRTKDGVSWIFVKQRSYGGMLVSVVVLACVHPSESRAHFGRRDAERLPSTQQT